MVRRHPHVFGNVKAETSGEVLKNWAQLKAKEKQALSAKGAASTKSRSIRTWMVSREIFQLYLKPIK